MNDTVNILGKTNYIQKTNTQVMNKDDNQILINILNKLIIRKTFQ